jgi:hypothetical protein
MNWNNSYYAALETYLWKPQYLRNESKDKGEGKKRRVDEIIASIKKLEEPLNHILNVFFSLAPSSLIARIVGSSSAGESFRSIHFTELRDAADSKVLYSKLCQPDAFFLGTKLRACIELKVGAKLDVQQVIKYAALMRLYSRDLSMPNRLILLGPKTFRDLWGRSSIDSEEKLREAIGCFESEKLERRLRKFESSLDEAKRFANSLELQFMPIPEFEEILSLELASLDARNPGDEVYVKLLSGMLDELQRRFHHLRERSG